MTLAFFKADAGADGVTLAWETVSEMDHVGFNVYRAAGGSITAVAGLPTEPPADLAWTRFNPALIPTAAPGSSEGHAYTWLDATAAPGVAYSYLLEDVALDGTTTRHPAVLVAPTSAIPPDAVGLARFTGVPTAGPALAGLAGLEAAVARRRRR